MNDKENTKSAPSGENMTINEVAERLGMTRDQVRQIEARAIRKIRQLLQRRNITARDVLL
jgi:DNA-directed RNA polymerase sigma subunit (sigma70/sigma32)